MREMDYWISENWGSRSPRWMSLNQHAGNKTSALFHIAARSVSLSFPLFLRSLWYTLYIYGTRQAIDWLTTQSRLAVAASERTWTALEIFRSRGFSHRELSRAARARSRYQFRPDNYRQIARLTSLRSRCIRGGTTTTARERRRENRSSLASGANLRSTDSKFFYGSLAAVRGKRRCEFCGRLMEYVSRLFGIDIHYIYTCLWLRVVSRERERERAVNVGLIRTLRVRFSNITADLGAINLSALRELLIYKNTVLRYLIDVKFRFYLHSCVYQLILSMIDYYL